MSKQMKRPTNRGVAKVPVVMQLEALECGAACLTMIAAYYGKWLPLEQVRADCGVSRDGSNAFNILRAARHYGLQADGYRYQVETLKKEGQFPCIIHWNFNHFVVLCGFKNGKAYLNDPARGNVAVSMETFDESFTGICLILSPTEDFVPSGKHKSILSFARRRLAGTGSAIALAVAFSVISALIALIQPVFARVFVDRLLSGTDPDWALPFLSGLIVFTAVQIIASALQNVYDLRINGKMAAVGNTTYMWKILHLPLTFFTQRMSGDIQSRQASNATIANSLIQTFAPLLLETFMMIFYLVVMIRYSLLLTIVGLGSMLINAVISQVIAAKRINITRVSMREEAKLSSTTIAGIQMIETIKASGAERGYFSRWAGHQAAASRQKVKFSHLNQYLGMIPQLIKLLSTMAVQILGVMLIMRGDFTVGMVMAFQGFLSSFMSPAMTLISAGQSLQEMRTMMERVDDVMEYPTEQVFAEESTVETAREKLRGQVEMKNIVFGYSPLAEPLIRDFSLTLTPGRSVAIVGSSGCGKSTVSKLISGLVQPWSGEILFDGKPMREIDADTFHASLAVVDQDVILFEDTIANNIKMWDSTIDDFDMIQAAQDAQIHQDIMARPDGYQNRLVEGGRDLSGGQRQRIEIARVLAQEPTIIVMDEATSALDAVTENKLVKAVRDRGTACLVIAHRLSTIRQCDEIIVMDQGSIVDRGTHAELMARCDMYHDLITNE